MKRFFLCLVALLALTACERKTAADVGKEKNKGIAITSNDEVTILEMPEGTLPKGSVKIETEPGDICPTQHPKYRLVPIFKVNYNKHNTRYVGNLSYLTNNSYDYDYNLDINRKKEGNNWHDNIVAGFNTVYGDGLVNIAVINVETKQQKLLFEKPTFIENLYYPTEENDTLNFKPVTRNYYMISCYDEDTNNDGYLNTNDLRHFYLYSLEGNKLKQLIPNGYGVIGSSYDGANDALYIYARQDTNQNGKIEVNEPRHIFLTDLKTPENTVLLYK